MFLFSLVLLALFVTVFYIRRSFTYWQRLQFPEVKPLFIFGNVKSVVTGEKSFGITIYELYKKTRNIRFVGIYLFFRPALLINDLDIVKNVLNNDFQHFYDRGVYNNVQSDPLSGGLFQLSGSEWKNLRQKLTPAFSSAKLKGMFSKILNVGLDLEKYLEQQIVNDNVVEMKDLLSRYIVDIVASTVFGFEVNTIRNPRHIFRDVGKSFTDPNLINGFRNAGFFLWPNLLKYTGIKFLPKSMRKFCIDVVKATVEERERNRTIRKDLMQSMIQLRNNNNIEQSDELKLETLGNKSMSIDQIAAQVFIMYIAGTESTSATTSFTLHELTQNPNLMKRAQEDVDSALNKHNQIISYESINEMSFIDLCVKETLRKYPALPILNRECTKDYMIPETNELIPKGTAVVISLLGIHRDENYFNDPLKYDPDRFSSVDFNTKAYFPFGDGQRNCIAYRMGILAIKVGLAVLLSKFNFTAIKKEEIEFLPNTIALDAKGGIKLRVTQRYSYWDSVGIPNLKGKIPYGNLQSVVRKQRSFGTAIYDIYTQTKEPFLGIYLFFRPAILMKDPELIKNVMVTDFKHFHDRGVHCDPKNDPMSASLFALPGDAWKSLRQKLTPAFTSGKLKGMFPSILNVGQNFTNVLNPMADKEQLIDIRDLAGRYVIDCLASIAFGQNDVSCLNDPNHDFRASLQRINDNSKFIDIIRRTAVFVCPKLLNLFRMSGLPSFMQEFCLKLVTKTVEERERNNIERKDLMQYLIQLRNSKEHNIDADEWKINSSNNSKKNMSIEEIAGNVFLFYIAGNESSSSTIAYTLYELTQNEDLLKQAQRDITSVLEKHAGELTYESIMDMNYIDLCVKETLRKYPGLPILNRECTQDYQIPNTKHFITKGTSIIISLLGIHRDSRFFPNPNCYDPERFTEEKHEYDEDMYMPFGTGPRNCIAFRMGLMVSKLAIVLLLLNFNFEATSKEQIEFDIGSVALLPKPGQCKIKIMRK
ncbi:CLUMA_CG000948, isoform A [Clunio marinus]|uniref:CLUMA_CG000948, isoform A n=1 Tax=Clunio marinus TaxID=568069 RepID=A0A1J1HGY2_9DIPT|nr:CLUMA_CG000948, isoform A [Clunio marinus]